MLVGGGSEWCNDVNVGCFVCGFCLQIWLHVAKINQFGSVAGIKSWEMVGGCRLCLI